MKVSISKRTEIYFNDVLDTKMCLEGVLKAVSFFKKHKLIVGATPKFWAIINEMTYSGGNFIQSTAMLKKHAKHVRLIIKPHLLSKKILDDPDFAEYAFIMFHRLKLKQKLKIESSIIKLFTVDIDSMARDALDIRLGIIATSLNECIEKQRRLLNEQTMISVAIKSGDVARFFEAPTIEELIMNDKIAKNARLDAVHKVVEAISTPVSRVSTKKKKRLK